MPPNSPRTSPTTSSPAMPRKQTVPPGFRAAPKPKRTPIPDMSLRELQDLHNLNAKILASPGASTSTYVHRVSAEQAAIEARLVELVGVETINTGLKNTAIIGDNDMAVDRPPEPPTSRTLEAKRKALSRYGLSNPDKTGVGSLNLQEAIELEQRAHFQDLERQQRILEKKKRLGMPIQGEVLTRQEREARIWAFMNRKPSESDLEDDDEDEDDEDDDPATWFEDDQDDGRKGQQIVEPDEEDFSEIIRIDEARIYSTFYEPRDDGD